jgi:hypothetical protein
MSMTAERHHSWTEDPDHIQPVITYMDPTGKEYAFPASMTKQVDELRDKVDTNNKTTREIQRFGYGVDVARVLFHTLADEIFAPGSPGYLEFHLRVEEDIAIFLADVLELTEKMVRDNLSYEE